MSAFLLRYGASQNIFPLGISGDSRGLIQVDGTPFPILGRAVWGILKLDRPSYLAVIQDSVNKGFNTFEVPLLIHWPQMTVAPFINNGTLLPFLKTLGGSAWSGSLSYGNPATDTPDFTTPNPAYWAQVDQFLDDCKENGIACFCFPSYCGFQGGSEGWMAEMVSNGATNMQAYGTFIQNRYANQKNVVWMAGGDYGTNSNTFTAPQLAVESALLTGLTSAKLFSAEWDTPSNAKDQTTFGSLMTLNGAYTFAGLVNAQGVSAYAQSPTSPAFLLEEPYDQEGSDGTNVNPAASQPCERFPMWGHLSTGAGYIAGNGFVWPFNSGYASHLTTVAQTSEMFWNFFVQANKWQFAKLVPSGQGSIGTLITSGAGTQDATSMATAACTPLGDFWVMYAGPGTAGSWTVDMTKLRGSSNWQWYDPTNGTFSTAATGLANTGTHVFNSPGNNSQGRADWVLVGRA